MNKKILVSLSVIGAVAAIAIGGTIAYFSDTETSTGNTFTAGNLDLIVSVDGNPENPLDGPIISGTGDMKPGDKGEVTLGLKVVDNPSCGFVNFNLKSDLDNDCTEPELIDDQSCNAQGTDNGELNDQVSFFIWQETDCDNVYESGEIPLTEGTLTEDETYQIGELPTENNICYGIAYCFGIWGAGMTCDGSGLNNASQGDSFDADLIISAKQKRNQYDNGCPIDWKI